MPANKKTATGPLAEDECSRSLTVNRRRAHHALGAFRKQCFPRARGGGEDPSRRAPFAV